MRLIDADAFLENNKGLADCYFVHPRYCDTLRDLVNNAPTVCDIEQIRKEISEWKDDKVIHAERNEMVDLALEIIDKHMGDSE